MLGVVHYLTITQVGSEPAVYGMSLPSPPLLPNAAVLASTCASLHDIVLSPREVIPLLETLIARERKRERKHNQFDLEM